MTLTRILTEDGSTTLLTSDGISYRSRYGAYTESEHVFVQPAIEHARQLGLHTLKIFEFGLGSGTNFLRTAALWPGALHYYAIDHAPIPAELFEDTPMTSLLQDVTRQNLPVAHAHDTRIQLTLERCDCLKTTCDTLADAIYHDPFGPTDNPDAWTRETFDKLLKLLKPGGILLTYSSAGHVRRALKSAGFIVHTRPGPARKREVTTAIRPE